MINRDGLTQLSYAVANSYEEIVKRLLEQVDIKLDTRAMECLTPLPRAGWDVHDGFAGPSGCQP